MNQDHINLFNQINRDVGTLISMLADSKLNPNDRQELRNISMRMDTAFDKLQPVLYPESISTVDKEGGA